MYSISALMTQSNQPVLNTYGIILVHKTNRNRAFLLSNKMTAFFSIVNNELGVTN